MTCQESVVRTRWLATSSLLGVVLALMPLGLTGCGGPETNSSDLQTRTAPPLGDGTTAEEAGEFQETASGLRYRILKESSGKKPGPTSRVSVNYRGWLDDGSEFDSGNGIAFGLNQVIAGWTEGLQLVGEGGRIELEIPPDLAYGPQELPGIPAGSTLHFAVDLLKVQ